MTQNFLAKMATASEQRVRKALRQESLDILRLRASKMPAPQRMKIGAMGFDIIAEIKLRTPSAGDLAADASEIATRARLYADAGAAAVSVLTEPDRFAGSLRHLELVSDALRGTGVPAMRKDFLVDPYQVWEARAAGAGGVLLILQMLSDEQMQTMIDTAREAGLFVLLEAFDREDLRRSRHFANTPGLLLGLNCRNLRSLAIEPGRFEQLAGEFPAGPPRVAESGLATAADVSLVAELGYDLALIGSALMQNDDPGAMLADMLEAGREVRV